MASDVATSPAFVRFTRNAATKMAGHTRYPSNEYCCQGDSRRRPYRRCARVQRGEHQTEFASDEVDESYDADEQQPRGTSQLHGPDRLNLSDFAPDDKADQRLDSCELCGTAARFSRITKPRANAGNATWTRITDAHTGRTNRPTRLAFHTDIASVSHAKSQELKTVFK